MSAVLTPTRVTPDEFYAMEQHGRGFELVDGKLQERTVSMESVRIGAKLASYIDSFINPKDLGWVYGSDLGYRCFVDDPGRVRKPDASYISIETLPLNEYEDEGFCTTVPDLVAEVISPNDNAYKVERKIKQWLEAGVPVVLKLLPETKSIQVYRQDGSLQQFTESELLEISDLLPGFSVPVTDLFRKPGEKASS